MILRMACVYIHIYIYISEPLPSSTKLLFPLGIAQASVTNIHTQKERRRESNKEIGKNIKNNV